MNKRTNIILDGDPLIYACGFGAEEHIYELITEDPDGKMHQDAWSDGNEMKKWKSENIKDGDWTFVSQEKIVTPLGEELARHILLGKLTEIVKAVERKVGKGTIGRIQLLLSGPGNFREWMATIRGYKSNRKENTKPYYYQYLRNLMTDEWAAEVVTGCEADDMASILAFESETGSYVVCSIDKDLDQIEGDHYNYQKDVFYEVDAEEGLFFFYQQALSGDAGDAIPGCYGVGTGKALKAIETAVEECEELELYGVDREQYIWAMIVDQYTLAAEKKNNPYEGDLTPEEQAIETARLVFMQHLEEELWNPPGIPNGIIEVPEDVEALNRS